MTARRMLIFTGFLLAMGLAGILKMGGSPQTQIKVSGANALANALLGRLYQRETDPSGNRIAQVVFVGDVMLGREVAKRGDVFDDVVDDLSGAQLLVGNLEGALAVESGASEELDARPEDLRLLFPPSAFALLQRAGFDLMSVANNHILDSGRAGKERTTSYLKRFGITPLGVHSQQIEYRSINGIRLAFLAYNAVAVPETDENLWRRREAIQTVRQARGAADAVIVLMHWGDEFAAHASPRQRQAAVELIEAGADLIVGCHPHVLQETQVVQALDGRVGFAAYSLGNFVFDQYDERARTGAALRVVFDRQGLFSVGGLPVRPGIRPRWLTGATAEMTIRNIRPQPLHQAFRCNPAGCEETVATQQYQVGGFWVDSIDLTGDGVAERIELRKGQLFLFERERGVWHSPPEWRVLDVAVGDPNRDGRSEVLIALEKPDQDGVMRSHPFIIGFRGGVYREVWGGSAVVDRIMEVELADVDQDGAEELIIIEEKCPRVGSQNNDKTGWKTNFDRGVLCGQAVAVWDWNGWGFSLFWRSFVARFQNLNLCNASGAEPILCVERLWY